MGYLSIVVGMALVVILMIRRWSPLMVGLATAATVIFMNGLPYGDTMSGIYFEGFCSMFKTLFPVIFSGCLLSQVYNRSGAVSSIADAFGRILFRQNSSPTSRYRSCILATALATGVVSYCGMNSLVTLIAMYPIALRLMEQAGIPKRFVMGILSCGVYSFALSAPGTTEIINILSMEALGTPSYAGLCGGIAAAITEITITTVLTTAMVKRAVARGEVFAYGPKDIIFDESKARPHPLLAAIPMLTLIILFNVFSVSIFAATLMGWLMSIVLFWEYLPKKDGSRRKEIQEICSDAGTMAFGPACATGAIVGFTSIAQSLPEFQKIMDTVFAMDLSPVLILLAVIGIISAMTSSSSSAIRVGIPIIRDRCLAAGLSSDFIHRVSCYAATVVDTLPYGTAVIINLQIADLDLKDAYPPMFVATTVATLCGTIVCALFMSIFPGLP